MSRLQLSFTKNNFSELTQKITIICQICDCLISNISIYIYFVIKLINKTFENLETAVNGTEISWKSFQKFRKLFNFRNANHSTENCRNSGSKVEWKENFRENFFENLGIPREVVLFFGNVGKSSLPVKVAGNSNRKFWLNGKRPECTTHHIHLNI